MIFVRIIICIFTMTIVGMFFTPSGQPAGSSTSWHQYFHEIMRVGPMLCETYAVLSVVPAAIIVIIAYLMSRKLMMPQMLADGGAWTIVILLIIVTRAIGIIYADLHPEKMLLFIETNPDETLADILVAIAPYYCVCVIVGCVLLAMARSCHNRIFRSVSP